MKSLFYEAFMAGPDSVAIICKKGRLLDVSEIKAAHCGKARRDMIGKLDADFLSPEEAKIACEQHQYVITTGNSITDFITPRTLDGKTYWYSISRSPVFDDNDVIMGSMVIARNITRRIEIEELLKTDIHSILHDLKNLLVGLIGMLSYLPSLLLKGKISKSIELIGQFNEENENCLERVKMTNLRISQLGLEKPEAPLNETLFDLHDLFDKVKSKFSQQMKNSNVCFDNGAGFINPGEITMKTVHDWLIYSMEQVMDNNLKFGGETLGRIALGFRKEPTQKRLLIIISTDGLKVPEEFAKNRMFKKGQRAEETADKDGTGFGLYTARQYMRQLGGDMWCEPKEEDEWMSFFIALPLDILE